MVHNPKLSRCHARDGLLRDDVGATLRQAYCAVGELWLVTDLEADALSMDEL